MLSQSFENMLCLLCNGLLRFDADSHSNIVMLDNSRDETPQATGIRHVVTPATGHRIFLLGRAAKLFIRGHLYNVAHAQSRLVTAGSKIAILLAHAFVSEKFRGGLGLGIPQPRKK
jgi:hypothetical protein